MQTRCGIESDNTGDFTDPRRARTAGTCVLREAVLRSVADVFLS
jgi:hypothetical protein